MTMIPPDAGLLLRQVLESPAQLHAPARVSALPADLPDLATGQTFTARIQEALPGNVFRALVAGRELLLQLPEGAKAGDTLELVVIDRTPRMLVAQLVEARSALAGLAESAYQFALISPSARLIASLLPELGEDQAPTPLNQGQPLLDKAPTSSAQLAPALQTAIKDSGLFYESHQAQWLAGALPLEQLLKEPQGRMSANPLPIALLPPQTMSPPASAAQQAALDSAAALPGAASTPGSALPEGAAGPAQTTPEHPPLAAGPALTQQAPDTAVSANDVATAQSVNRMYGAALTATPLELEQMRNSFASVAASQQSAERGALTAHTAEPANQLTPPVPDALRPLVQHQLEALASQRLLYSVEAWPNQRMDWELAREDERGRVALPDEEAAVWRTSLRLETPQLGLLGATLRLTGTGLHVALSSMREQSSSALRNALPDLLGALDAAGIKVLSTQVHHAART